MTKKKPITIPLCHLPNSRVQTAQPVTAADKYQAGALAEIAEKPEFAYFVFYEDEDGQPVVWQKPATPDKGVMWYDRDGRAHLTTLGLDSHSDAVTAERRPAPLDGKVYQVRTEAPAPAAE